MFKNDTMQQLCNTANAHILTVAFTTGKQY